MSSTPSKEDPQGPCIGCVADDFTGATDLAGLLRRSGMSVLQCFGIPSDAYVASGYDAVVVALKSRSIDASLASEQSVAAIRWLRSIDARRFFFKYCSTFDSTSQGNIGPVAAAITDELKQSQTLFCPAFPENGRTVYQGHLFVGDKLLNESGMQNHPLNPMTDSNLMRVLAGQCDRDVGVLPIEIIAQGQTAIRDCLSQLPSFVICDSIASDDLKAVAQYAVSQDFVTGGSAIAGEMATFVPLDERSTTGNATSHSGRPGHDGKAAIVAGSCSLATQEQVSVFEAKHPVLRLQATKIAESFDEQLAAACRWFDEHSIGGPVLIASTAEATELHEIQNQIGVSEAADLIERFLSSIAVHMVDRGIDRLIVAGGETSGAVISRLGIEAIEIGNEIAPGVPWTRTIPTSPDATTIELALKSGNFGSKAFFEEALATQL